MFSLNRKSVSPVIAIVLLLMMTVAAAGAAYFWITSMQSSVQQSAGSQIEAITKQTSTRVIAQATICKVPTKGNLVGYWKFNEGSGTTAEDSSGNGNDGTIYGANWTDGKVGQALKFDGVDDRVDIQDFTLINDTTITGWIRPEEISDGNIACNADCGWGNNGFCFALHSSGQLFFHLGNGTQHESTYSSITVKPNNWNFVSVAYDDSSNNATFYIDGKKRTSTYSNVLTYLPQDYIRFGSEEGSGSEFPFNGTIDELRIYNSSSEKTVAMQQVDITVYNAGTEEVPAGAWVANLKKGENIIESDVYNATELESKERITLNFYFDKMKPNKEYKIELEGTETSTTVSC